ncbi:MAG: hypothetical protein ACI97P_002335, partial [Arcticibacterium sp.]
PDPFEANSEALIRISAKDITFIYCALNWSMTRIL